MEEKAEILYRKFCQTGQAKLRLETAIEGFFDENSESFRADYGEYLKHRIRPAMESMIRREELERMEVFWQLGWIGKKELELFLREAGDRGKLEVFVWLLRKKDEKFGYEDRDFSL